MNFFDSDRNGKNHGSINRERWFWKSSKFKTEILQYVFGHQDFNARIKIQNFSNEPSSKTLELSSDTLVGENKPVATQNIKFED